MPTNHPLPPPHTPHRLEFVAYGLPTAQGSKRLVGHGRMIESGGEKLRTWRLDVKAAALDAVTAHPTWRTDYTQLAGWFAFTLPRTQDHFRSGKNTHVLREDAPEFHSKRPDLDKLLRSTWDSLTTAGAYEDDSRLVRVWAVKVFPNTFYGLKVPGVRIHLVALDPTRHGDDPTP